MSKEIEINRIEELKEEMCKIDYTLYALQFADDQVPLAKDKEEKVLMC